MATPPTVFLCYSHDSEAHARAVKDLAERLRGDGVDATIPAYEMAPEEGWPRWFQKQVLDSKFVLIVCTEALLRRFNGEEPDRSIAWMNKLITQRIFEDHARNHAYIPVHFTNAGRESIPAPLRGYSNYRLPGEYDRLYRHLTEQPEHAPTPLGSTKDAGADDTLDRYFAWLATVTERLDLRDLPEQAADPRAHSDSLRCLFVHPQLIKSEPARASDPDATRPSLALAELVRDHPRALILGAPGGGKSTLLRYLALACADVFTTLPTLASPELLQSLHRHLRGATPVLVELALDRRDPPRGDSKSIHALLGHHLDRSLGPELAAAVWPHIRAGLDEGTTLVLLDGVDEIYEDRVALARSLEQFTREHPKARIIATTRPEAAVAIDGFCCFTLAPLTVGEQRDFLRRREIWRADEDTQRDEILWRGDELSDRIRRAADLRELAKTPLLLEILRLAIAELPPNAGRVDLYEIVVAGLITRPRVTATRLDQRGRAFVIAAWSEAALELLRAGKLYAPDEGGLRAALAAALRTLGTGPAALTDVDLLLQIGIEERGLLQRLRDGQYRFWHATIAEHLAARAVTNDLDQLEARAIMLRELPDNTHVLLTMALEHIERRWGDRVQHRVIAAIAFAEPSAWEPLLADNLRSASALLRALPPTLSREAEELLTALAVSARRLPPLGREEAFVALARHLPVQPAPAPALVTALLGLLDDTDLAARPWVVEEVVRHILPASSDSRVTAAFGRIIDGPADAGIGSSTALTAYAALGLWERGRADSAVLAAIAAILTSSASPLFERARDIGVRRVPDTDLIRKARVALTGFDPSDSPDFMALDPAQRLQLRALASDTSDAVVDEVWAAVVRDDRGSDAGYVYSYLAVLDRRIAPRLLAHALEREDHDRGPNLSSTAESILDVVVHAVDDLHDALTEAVLDSFPVGEARGRRFACDRLQKWAERPQVRARILDRVTQTARGDDDIDPQFMLEVLGSLPGSRAADTTQAWREFLHHSRPRVRVDAARRCLGFGAALGDWALRALVDVIRARPTDDVPGRDARPSRDARPLRFDEIISASSPASAFTEALRCLSYFHSRDHDAFSERLERIIQTEPDAETRAALACSLVHRAPQRLSDLAETLRPGLTSAHLETKRETAELLVGGVRSGTLTAPSRAELQVHLLELVAATPLEHGNVPWDLLNFLNATLPIVTTPTPTRVVALERLWHSLGLHSTEPDKQHSSVASPMEWLEFAWTLVNHDDPKTRDATHSLILRATSNAEWCAWVLPRLDELDVALAFKLATALVRRGSDPKADAPARLAALAVYRRAIVEGSDELRREALIDLWRSCPAEEASAIARRECIEVDPAARLDFLRRVFTEFLYWTDDRIRQSLPARLGLTATRLGELLIECLELPAGADRLVATVMLAIIADADDRVDASYAALERCAPEPLKNNDANLLCRVCRGDAVRRALSPRLRDDGYIAVPRAAMLVRSDRRGSLTAALREALREALRDEAVQPERWRAIELWTELEPTDWRPLLELLCTTSDPPTWSHALSFAVHRVARDDVSRAAVSEWLLDHVFLRGPLSEIEGMRSLLEYNVCASRDDEDSNAASSEARVQALFDQVIEPALRQRFDAARSDRQQLTILEVLTHLDRVRPDDRAYAACVTKHAAHDDPELRAIAWELADRLLVTLLEHLAPWLTELAQGDADDVHWLLQQSYALPDELLRVTLQAGIGRALTNKGALFWAAWQLLERTPGDPQAWAVVEQCLAAGPPRRVLVIATLWIKHGRPSDPIRRMLIEVGRDGSPEEQLGAAFALHQLLHEHERAHELALRVLERTSSSDEARMVALCLVAAGVERRALIRLILELPTAPHRDSSRLAFAVLLRLGRGVEPLPLPEPSRFDEFWIDSIKSDVIRPTLAEIDRTLGFRTLHSSAFGAKLAKIPDDQLPKELASVLAELVDEHAHELHRALTRCSAAHRDHELLARAVIGQPEDALAQRIARAWVYAKIDRQRARADVRTTRAARRP